MYDIKLLKALSDETRVNIVLKLLEKECTVTELVSYVKKSQPNVSLALRKLENASVVEFRKEGKNAIYSIKNKSKIMKILDLVNE